MTMIAMIKTTRTTIAVETVRPHIDFLYKFKLALVFVLLANQNLRSYLYLLIGFYVYSNSMT